MTSGPIEMWAVYHKGQLLCARTTEVQAKCYASGFSDSSQVEIKRGVFTPDSDPNGSTDSWELILREHELTPFWCDAWTRADRNRKPPYLQVTQEYIHRRWDLANRRMKHLMDRIDRFMFDNPQQTP